MKLLLENWRQYLNEELKSFAQGEMFDTYAKENPEETMEIFKTMGADKKILKQVARYTGLLSKILPAQGSYYFNQIVAVLAGKKPMFYSNLRSVHQVPFMDFIISNLGKLNLKHYSQGDYIVLGQPKNVDGTAPEIDRMIKNNGKMDSQFHRTMGLNLGYEPDKVEQFITATTGKHFRTGARES
jgi:hypothetical protein|tara:strand:+ start:540 stop:1091 length:552 start_codon:yes stop_codon:yes gene_type:complete